MYFRALECFSYIEEVFKARKSEAETYKVPCIKISHTKQKVGVAQILMYRICLVFTVP